MRSGSSQEINGDRSRKMDKEKVTKSSKLFEKIKNTIQPWGVGRTILLFVVLILIAVLITNTSKNKNLVLIFKKQISYFLNA